MMDCLNKHSSEISTECKSQIHKREKLKKDAKAQKAQKEGEQESAEKDKE